MRRLTIQAKDYHNPHMSHILARIVFMGVFIGIFCLDAPAHATDIIPRSGIWRAWLDSPGGELPFGLDISQFRTSWSAWIINGPERIKIPSVTLVGNTMTFEIDYYDSAIKATVSKAGKRLDGAWKKHGPGETWVRLPFHATRGQAPRFQSEDKPSGEFYAPPLIDKWAVDFSKTEEESIGLLNSTPDGLASGNFLTETGDYRYLAGSYKYGHLRLSTFDGAHAFLFDAHSVPLYKLKGDFWSGDTWHETWTAELNPLAQTPDPLLVTSIDRATKLDDLSFPDLEGNLRKLSDKAFAGKVRIIELFGSWCPNCHDAASVLNSYQYRYGNQGLSILGLAFEQSGSFERDARQVRRFLKLHKIIYPVLIAGVSDKDSASKSFPVIDHVHAYPTFIFVDHNNRIRSIYTGFTGPAARAEHLTIRWRFERLIEKLLKEADDDASTVQGK